jgi:hypothetical protein
MVRISRNNLSFELIAELERISTIGDVIGSVDTYAHLPQKNNKFVDENNLPLPGLNLVSTVTQIMPHDLIVVNDASEQTDGENLNAIYEAGTTKTAGDDIVWTFLYSIHVPTPPEVHVPIRTKGLAADFTMDMYTATVKPEVTGTCYTAATNNRLSVEVYINGLNEPNWTIQNVSGKYVLTLTGYPYTGWTSDDSLEVYAWV